jgi:cytidylate kinase
VDHALISHTEIILSKFPSIIAIDGPAASGKSTLAIALAKYLDYLYFDTGVMYRGITLIALAENSELPDESRCVSLAESSHIDIRPPSVDDGRLYDVLIDGRDHTLDIRLPEVDAKVSIVSAYPGVRKALTKQQRRIGTQGRVVMVGRDIGTVVLPEADLKIFLDASVEERARRRHLECLQRGDDVDFETVLASMKNRDSIDANRAIAPLKPAPDAVRINSDEKSAGEIFSKVVSLLENPQPQNAKRS